ncbi:restriction endonuclease subunit S [Macrococcoides caseolyticum]|uniref:restriction endonuclease subunit S n=1 Tax=Macrococcoides caseolyticum TaxID=69966 RepID=UPI0018E190BE|nr:restriction endonuclease subunit S [Macrococcus caseolyticus]QQB04596.1 restriction endonuclease subunit S [Macrococcus caseolyticus]
MSNVPDIRFKGFTDAWEQRELGEVVQLINGKAFKQNELLDDGKYRVLRVGNFNTNNQWYYSNLELPKDKYIDKGDLVYLWATTFGPEFWNEEKVIYHYHIWKVNIIDKNLDKNYLYSWMKYDKNKILNNTNGSTMIHITKENMDSRKIKFPNIEEQIKIGQIFGEIDRTITLLQRELDLENKTIEMFMDNLFIQKEQNIPCFNLSENTSLWKSVKLKEIGDTFTGLSGKNKDDFGHGDAWYITYMNVFSNPISNFNDKEKIEIDFKQNEVKYGDIFFTTSSETPNEVGMSSVWLGDDANIYLNSFCFGFRPKVELDPYFIAYLLRSKEVRMKISKLAQGISRYNISKTKMMEIEINIPDIKTQNEVGRILKELHEKKQITEKQIEKAKIIKKAFLQKLFPKGD